MMNRIFLKLLAAALASMALSTSSLSDEDHLKPEDSPLGFISLWFRDYYFLVGAAFKEAFENDVKARVIVLSSFDLEFVVGVKEKDGSFLIFALQPESKLWGYALIEENHNGSLRVGPMTPLSEKFERQEITNPEAPKEIRIARCERKIDSILGMHILEVWKNMLLQTRHNDYVDLIAGHDGTDYHFSMGALPDYSGQTGLPLANSKTGALVDIVHTMLEYCDSGDRKQRTRLSNDVASLKARLN